MIREADVDSDPIDVEDFELSASGMLPVRKTGIVTTARCGTQDAWEAAPVETSCEAFALCLQKSDPRVTSFPCRFSPSFFSLWCFCRHRAKTESWTGHELF